MSNVFLGLTGWQWLAIAAGAAYLLLAYGGPLIGKAISGFKSLPAIGGQADDDVLDLQAVKRVRARGERLGCPEMQKAADDAMAHFFHGTGGAT